MAPPCCGLRSIPPARRARPPATHAPPPQPPTPTPAPQDLNPLPFPALVANCAGWVGYAYVTNDVLVLWPNAAGFLLGMFYTLSAYGLADTKTRDRQIAIALLFSTGLIVVGSVGELGGLSQHSQKTLWGFTANGEAWPAGGGAGGGVLGAASLPRAVHAPAPFNPPPPPPLPLLPQPSCSSFTRPRCPRCCLWCARAAPPRSTCRCR